MVNLNVAREIYFQLPRAHPTVDFHTEERAMRELTKTELDAVSGGASASAANVNTSTDTSFAGATVGAGFTVTGASASERITVVAMGPSAIGFSV
jgi:hypothetical protein